MNEPEIVTDDLHCIHMPLCQSSIREGYIISANEIQGLILDH